MKTRLKIQLSAFGGIVAPLLFLIVSTMDGCTRPNYDPFRNYISKLSLGPDGWIQIANFLAVGLGIFAFTWGVRREFRRGKASVAGPLLMALIGVGFIGSGLFPVDTPLHSAIHVAFARAGVFFPMPLACFVFARRFKDDRRWRAFTAYTIGTGLVLVPLAFFPYAHSRWPGLFQRLHVAVWLLWMVAVAIRMRVLAERDRGMTMAPPAF